MTEPRLPTLDDRHVKHVRSPYIIHPNERLMP